MQRSQTQIRCYFSKLKERNCQIRDQYANAKNQRGDFFNLDDSDLLQDYSNFQDNVSVSVSPKESSYLAFTCDGGTQIQLNVESKITGLFKLKEGFLLEFEAKKNLIFEEIHSLIDHKPQLDMNMEEEGQISPLKNYSYVVLNHHPKDAFKALQYQEYSPDNEVQQSLWFDLPQQILFVDPFTSLALVFDHSTQQHKLIVLNYLFKEVQRYETEITPFTPSPLYSLKLGLLGDTSLIQHSVEAIVLYSLPGLCESPRHKNMSPATSCEVVVSYQHDKTNFEQLHHHSRRRFLVHILDGESSTLHTLSTEISYNASADYQDSKFKIGNTQYLGIVENVLSITSAQILNRSNSLVNYSNETSKYINRSEIVKSTSLVHHLTATHQQQYYRSRQNHRTDNSTEKKHEIPHDTIEEIEGMEGLSVRQAQQQLTPTTPQQQFLKSPLQSSVKVSSISATLSPKDFENWLVYQAGHQIMMQESSKSLNDCLVLQISSKKSKSSFQQQQSQNTNQCFDIYMDNSLIFSFKIKKSTFKTTSLSLDQFESGVWRLHSISKKQIFVKNQNNLKYSLGEVFPQLECPLTCSVLDIARVSLSPQIFRNLLSDTLVNTLDLKVDSLNKASHPADQICFKESSLNPFDRLIYYFIYSMLRAASSNNPESDRHQNLKTRKRPKTNDKGAQPEELGEYNWNMFKKELISSNIFADLIDILPDISLKTSNELSFQEDNEDQVVNRGNENLPIFGLDIKSFCEEIPSMLKLLHLFYEDLKLNFTMETSRNSIGFLLFSIFSFSSLPHSANYLDFYTRDQPSLPFIFRNDEVIVALLDMQPSNKAENIVPLPSSGQGRWGGFGSQVEEWNSSSLEKEPYSIMKVVRFCLRTKPGSRYLFSPKEIAKHPLRLSKKFPVIFSTTDFVLKMLSIHFLQGRAIGLSCKELKGSIAMRGGNDSLQQKMEIEESSSTKNQNQTSYDYFPISKPCFIREERSILLQRCMQYTSFKKLLYCKERMLASEKLLIFLVKRATTISYLQLLIPGLAKVVASGIRGIKEHMPSLIYRLPLAKRVYELVGRLDIYFNKQLYPKVRNGTKTRQRRGGRTTHRQSRSSYYQGTPSFLSEKRGTPSFLEEAGAVSREGGLYSTTTKLRFDGETTLGVNPGKSNSFSQGLLTQPKPIDDPRLLKLLSSNLHYKSTDSIFKETVSLLDIASHMKIRTSYLKDCTEMEVRHELLVHLKRLSLRRLSSMAGRGAFSINTSKTTLSDGLDVPPIRLSAIFEKDLSKVVLDKTEADVKEMINWARFHNGVGVALRISKEMLQSFDKETIRTWIKFQKIEETHETKEIQDPKEYSNPGLLLGFGLQGMLKSLLATDIYTYLKECKEVMSIGVLLGLAASRLGTKEERAHKAFTVHIRSLMRANSDLKIDQLVESSALFSMGLLYAQSSDLFFSDFMLAQIAAQPVLEHNPYRECYSLSAGFALGFINLARGNSLGIKNETRLEERLLEFINGGKREDYLHNNERMADVRSSNIKQGNYVNTQLTAPSALIAICLIYMKTRKESLTRRLAVPETLYEISNCNLNHILLKVTARNLIMWDSIVPLKTFVEDQIPDLIANLASPEGTLPAEVAVEDIDFSGVALIYYSSIGGSILALGLKYAGTGNEDAKELILGYIDQLLEVELVANDFVCDEDHRGKIDPYYLYNIICVCLSSVSMVMAGTADIQCLKKARIIRKHLQFRISSSSFGLNMAVHQAIGFLSLGKGGYTFGRESVHTAGLLAAVYPHWPSSPQDNKYHLQAYRHFYALAVVPNLFHAIDIDVTTSEPVSFEVSLGETPLRDSMNTTVSNKRVTPAYLHGVGTWKRVKLDNLDYYSTDFTFEQIDENNPPRMLYIKKKFDRRVDMKQLEKTLKRHKAKESITQKEINDIFGSFYLGSLYTLLQKSTKKTKLTENAVDFLCNNRKAPFQALQTVKHLLWQQKEPEVDHLPKTGNLVLRVMHRLLKKEGLDFFEDYLEFMLFAGFRFSRVSRLLNMQGSQLADHFLTLDNFMCNRLGIYNGSQEERRAENGLCRVLKIQETMSTLEAREIHNLRESCRGAMQGSKQHLNGNYRAFTDKFRMVGDLKKFVAKQKMLDLALFGELTAFCTQIVEAKNKLESQAPEFNEACFWEVLENDPEVQRKGLATILRGLLVDYKQIAAPLP